MPNWPFFCPYMNMSEDEDDYEDDFRSPDGMPPFGQGHGQGPQHGPGQGQGPGFQPPPFGPGNQPPFGPGGPGGPGFGPGGQGGPGGAFPPGPPPAMTPNFAQTQGFGGGFGGGFGVKAVDPGSIRRCLYRFVFIRLNNGRQFWAWLTFVGRTSVAGYRWNGRRWVYFGIDLRRIDEFICF